MYVCKCKCIRCINKPLKLKQAAFINYAQRGDVMASPKHPIFTLDTPITCRKVERQYKDRNTESIITNKGKKKIR